MGGFQNIGKIPELKRRILMSSVLLAVYRVGVHIPTPGIDGRVLAGIFERGKGTLLGFFDMFAGGGLERLSYLRWASCHTSVPPSSCSSLLLSCRL